MSNYKSKRIMKKNYIAPAIKVRHANIEQMICLSLETNVGLKYGGEAPDDFNEESVRSRQTNIWSDWEE